MKLNLAQGHTMAMAHCLNLMALEPEIILDKKPHKLPAPTK